MPEDLTGKPRLLRDRAEVMRDELFWRQRIIAVMQDGPKTLPEIAAALGQPNDEVTIWVMGMRRYGLIEELPKSRADDYFPYELKH